MCKKNKGFNRKKNKNFASKSAQTCAGLNHMLWGVLHVLWIIMACVPLCYVVVSYCVVLWCDVLCRMIRPPSRDLMADVIKLPHLQLRCTRATSHLHIIHGTARPSPPLLSCALWAQAIFHSISLLSS